jgi:hypothetical protein
MVASVSSLTITNHSANDSGNIPACLVFSGPSAHSRYPNNHDYPEHNINCQRPAAKQRLAITNPKIEDQWKARLSEERR